MIAALLKINYFYLICSKMNTQEIVSPAQLESDVSMALADLNMDCLLKIFRFLSLADVARVSAVCQRFQSVAVETFKYEWKNKTVRLSNNSMNSKLESTEILRHFGKQLQKVDIIFGLCRNDTFFEMIIDKCSPQLTQVDFSSTCFNVEIEKILSKENISRFNAKFGNLKRLRFENNTDDITEPECIEQHFPALEELSLCGYPFKNQNVQHFVKRNAQIKSLSLFHCNKVEDAKSLMQIIDQQLPQLEALGLWIHGDSHEIEYQSRFLKSLKRLTVHNYGRSSNLQHLSISCDKIEEMELEVGFCDEHLINFICQYKQLNKLAIRMYADSPLDCNFLRKLSQQLPKLTEVEIGGFWKNLNHSDIANFVLRSVALEKFTLRDRQRKNLSEDMHKIQQNLDSAQWTIAYNLSPRQLNFVRGNRSATH